MNPSVGYGEGKVNFGSGLRGFFAGRTFDTTLDCGLRIWWFWDSGDLEACVCVCVYILRPAEHVLMTRVLGSPGGQRTPGGFRPPWESF
jgi:hypothetical protein